MSADNLTNVSSRALIAASVLWPSWPYAQRALESSESFFAISLYAEGEDSVWMRYLADTLLCCSHYRGANA